MVKLVLGNIYSKIVGYLPEEVHNQLYDILSWKVSGAKHIPSVKAKQWDGFIRLYMRSKGQSFYTGLASFVREILTKNNIEFQIVDLRERPTPNMPDLVFRPPHNYEDRDYQDFTIDRAIKFTRGVLGVCTGGGKCLGKGTKILMFDGRTKAVENVLSGDLLMGPDSKPRRVNGVTSGYGELYLVSQNNGEDFVCNDEHILCLKKTGYENRKANGDGVIEITASQFYNSSKRFKHYHKGYKVGVEFLATTLSIDPYWFGLWLGDGSSASPDITTGDKEIVRYLYGYADSLQMYITEQDGNGCKTYCFVKTPHRLRHKTCKYKKCSTSVYSCGYCRKHYDLQCRSGLCGRRVTNPLRDALRELGVLGNKHLPDCYKYNDRESRLKLLAGLIDADGSFSKVGAVEFYNSSKSLAEDVCWLARSLGFRASCNIKKASIKKLDYSGISYRVRISGKISDIPSLLHRKQAGNKSKYLPLQYGIFVKPIGKGEYYGFEIDGDGRFLLGDFTVTHNTMMVTRMISEIKTYPFIFYVLTKDLMEQAHGVLSSCLNTPIGRIGDGKSDIQRISVCTIQTAIRALNNQNKSFKISDYQFDEEDKWNEKDLESLEKAERIQKLISMAKGIYFDETHHAASKVCKEVLTASSNAYWRFGGSATPYRETGDDILIQAMFGAKIVDISASYLIRKGWLIKPYIIFEPIEDHVSYRSYPKIYSKAISNNESFNAHVAEQAKYLVKNGLSCLVLVQHYPQGNMLKKMIPNAEFITGKMPTTKRTKLIEQLRTRDRMCLIATSLADEGLDIPTLDSVLLAGGGASSTRVNQRIGRTLRKPTGVDADKKKRSIVIIYEHDSRYLEKHAMKIRRILKREKEFEIINSKGRDFIFDELDHVMGLTGAPRTIFDD